MKRAQSLIDDAAPLSALPFLRSLLLLVGEGKGARRLLRTPLLATLVVDCGSGTLAVLVFLVTFLFELCSLRLSSGLRCSASWPL